MAALLFILFWVLLGTTLVVVAASGGPAGARERVLHSQSRRGRRITALVIAVVMIGMGIAVPTLVVAGNEEADQAGDARVKLTAKEKQGRELFGQRCNQCHTLAAADTVGQTGPNLDKLKPPKALVLDAILNGRARGIGTMPAQLVQGEDATNVADFVAAVAGKQ